MTLTKGESAGDWTSGVLGKVQNTGKILGRHWEGTGEVLGTHGEVLGRYWGHMGRYWGDSNEGSANQFLKVTWMVEERQTSS